MKFGIIKERKNPLERRVVFSPSVLLELKRQYPEIEIKVESSDNRIFQDQEYIDSGFEVTEDLSDCDILLGVKEVPAEDLISNKKYFFFSHTIKKQSKNKGLLQSVLQKNIELYDYEALVDESGKRLIGFGRYAGIVGAYNAIRAFGVKFELFNLPKAETLPGKDALLTKLKRQFLPPIKIVLTGQGRVAAGVREILDGVKVKRVSVQDFLTKNYSSPVYVQLDVTDYNKRIDGTQGSKEDFYQNPSEYVSDFERFSQVADVFIAGHYFAPASPDILTSEMLRNKNCKLKVVADISTDLSGPIACTKQISTIAEPLYGYLPSEDTVVDVFHPAAIVVMAVDNLPCELPKEASEEFGQNFIEKIIPAFFNGDKDGILAKAKITQSGKLTSRFQYLQDYVEAK